MGTAEPAIFWTRKPFWIEQALGVANGPSRWQRVIHGEALTYRVVVLEELAETWGGERTARFSLCGQGDRICKTASGKVRVRPLGCGEPLCPRCSRRRGVRVLRALDFRFREFGHGFLFHIVMTQHVRNETLQVSRDRMEAKWKIAQRWLKKEGPVGMVCVTHCNWSRHGGFHFHLHVVAEFAEDREFTDFCERWQSLESGTIPAFAKRVAVPRTAEECQSPVDLFTDSDAVGSGLGYVVGEVVKGVGVFGTLGCPRRRLKEIVGVVHGLKRVRLYGKWRTCVRDLRDAQKKDKEAKTVGAVDVEDEKVDWEVCSFLVDDAYCKARAGVGEARDLLRGLGELYVGASFFSELVRSFCMEALVKR